jgi:hypothetical protein
MFQQFNHVREINDEISVKQKSLKENELQLEDELDDQITDVKKRLLNYRKEDFKIKSRNG